jgi:hypothetical protein
MYSWRSCRGTCRAAGKSKARSSAAADSPARSSGRSWPWCRPRVTSAERRRDREACTATCGPLGQPHRPFHAAYRRRGLSISSIPIEGAKRASVIDQEQCCPIAGAEDVETSRIAAKSAVDCLRLSEGDSVRWSGADPGAECRSRRGWRRLSGAALQERLAARFSGRRPPAARPWKCRTPSATSGRR